MSKIYHKNMPKKGRQALPPPAPTNNNNGNPVPSLDKIIGVIYEEHYEMHRRGAYDFPDKKRWVKNQIKSFKLNNPDLLQNGVETTKERPKCNKCEFNGDYIDAKCKHCGKPME